VRVALARLPEEIRSAAERLVVAAYTAGVSVERARISAILDLPRAHGFERFAWALAKSGDLTLTEADQALAAAAVDAAADAAAVAAAGAERQATTILH
jgi:hypothetical protein